MGSLKGFLTGLSSFQSGIFPQPDSRWTKRKSYFQCFTFHFFSMAGIKAGLLLKQHHPKSPASLGALWTVCTRVNAHTVHIRLRSSQVVIKDQMLCHHPKSLVSLGALWAVCTRLNARTVHIRLHSSQLVIKDQMLCHDIGTTCTEASSYWIKMSSIIGRRRNLRQ